MESQIKGATLEKLIAYLTSNHSNTLTYMFTFVLTYPAYTNSEEVMDLLILRFNSLPPDSVSPSDYHIFRADALLKIRLRVLNFLKHWIGMDPNEFHEGTKTRKKCDEFLDIVMEMNSFKPGYYFFV